MEHDSKCELVKGREAWAKKGLTFSSEEWHTLMYATKPVMCACHRRQHGGLRPGEPTFSEMIAMGQNFLTFCANNNFGGFFQEGSVTGRFKVEGPELEVRERKEGRVIEVDFRNRRKL
jgi:hypothetical protein